MKRFIVLMAFAVICMVSCKNKQENYYMFQGAEMGTVSNGTFTTDGGVQMNIIEAPAGSDITTKRRVMLFFSLETDGTQMLVYDIKVSRIVDPLILEPAAFTPENEDDEASPAGDPLNVSVSWFGGGYLNVYTYYYVDSSKETEQSFSLTYDIKGKVAKLILGRDGKGEGYFVEAPKEGEEYLCIPMQPVWQAFMAENGGEVIIDDEGSRSMEVSLNWLWYKSSGTDYANETYAASAKGTYYPDND